MIEWQEGGGISMIIKKSSEIKGRETLDVVEGERTPFGLRGGGGLCSRTKSCEGLGIRGLCI